MPRPEDSSPSTVRKPASTSPSRCVERPTASALARKEVAHTAAQTSTAGADSRPHDSEQHNRHHMATAG